MNVDYLKLYFLQLIYSIRIGREISEKVLLINIDETNLSPSVFNNRSWLKRGVACELITKRFKGSVSLVLAITSEGDFFGITLNTALNSKVFIEYLKMLRRWVNTTYMHKWNKIVVILDN